MSTTSESVLERTKRLKAEDEITIPVAHTEYFPEVQLTTVYKWGQRGVLESYTVGPRKIMTTRQACERLIERCGSSPSELADAELQSDGA